MFSTLRTSAVRQIPALHASALALPRPSTLSVSLRANLSPRALAIGGSKRTFVNVCFNCRREGHTRAECTAPTICVACGVEGHQRKDCPNPDPARLEALKTAPIQCFRCGEKGHSVSACKQPAKCFICGETDHIRRNCPQNPQKAEKAPASAPKVEAEVAAAA